MKIKILITKKLIKKKTGMKKLILILFCLFLPTVFLLAQSTGIKGRLADTAEHKNLQNSVIALLNKNDSTLVNFTRAAKDGAFELKTTDNTQNYY